MLTTTKAESHRFQLMALAHIEKQASNIRARREALGLTQEEVADRMHDAKQRLEPGDPDKTTGQMVSGWERAAHPPSPAKLELLAEALETTVGALSASPPAQTETPDLMRALSPNGDAESRLDEIDRLLREAVKQNVATQNALLAGLAEVRTAQGEILSRLERIERKAEGSGSG